MAEVRAEQGAFGWAAEPAAHDDGRAATHRARRPTQRSAGLPLERTVASASEGLLPPDSELWDVHAAARFLKRSVSWVYHKAEDGTLPVRRLGGWGIRFIPGELRGWVEGGAAGQRGR
jgi:predicted DNA-binding transcriptional regulator AlpA